MKMTVKYKINSPVLVMRITSVPQFIKCTKAPSPATAPFDSCHGRVIRKSTKFVSYIPPTAVVKLLQYSGLGSNTGMGFLRTNDLSEVKNGEFNLDFKVWLKNSEVLGFKTENKMKKNKERTP